MVSISSSEGSFKYFLIFLMVFIAIGAVLTFAMHHIKGNHSFSEKISWGNKEKFWGENLGEIYDYDFSNATLADGSRFPLQQNQLFPDNDYPELKYPNRNTLENQAVPNKGVLQEKYGGWDNTQDPFIYPYETIQSKSGIEPSFDSHGGIGRGFRAKLTENFTSTGIPQGVIPKRTLPRDLNYKSSPVDWSFPGRLFPYQGYYPNINLPAQVIGCGGRNIPCAGGRQLGIQNPPWTKDISENNIAPVNIATISDWKDWRYVGKLYKIWGDYNYTYPLYARKLKSNPFDDHWAYATEILNKKREVIPKRKTGFLGDNDVVTVEGGVTPWRVTMFENKFPVSIPNQMEKTV